VLQAVLQANLLLQAVRYCMFGNLLLQAVVHEANMIFRLRFGPGLYGSRRKIHLGGGAVFCVYRERHQCYCRALLQRSLHKLLILSHKL